MCEDERHRAKEELGEGENAKTDRRTDAHGTGGKKGEVKYKRVRGGGGGEGGEAECLVTQVA